MVHVFPYICQYAVRFPCNDQMAGGENPAKTEVSNLTGVDRDPWQVYNVGHEGEMTTTNLDYGGLTGCDGCVTTLSAGKAELIGGN